MMPIRITVNVGTTGASAATVQTTEVIVGMSEYTVTSTRPV